MNIMDIFHQVPLTMVHPQLKPGLITSRIVHEKTPLWCEILYVPLGKKISICVTQVSKTLARVSYWHIQSVKTDPFSALSPNDKCKPKSL